MTKQTILSICLILLISISVKSQITLNGTVSLDENFHTEDGNDYNLGYLPQYGYILYMYEYDTMNETSKAIKIYDLSSNLIKEIDCTSLDTYNLNTSEYKDGKEDITISQYLFNKDDKIEFIVYDYNTTHQLIVYNEDLEIVFSFPTGQWGYRQFNLICIDDETPEYKLQYNTENYCYIYDVNGDPFSTTGSLTESSSIKQDVFKCATILPNPSNGTYFINLTESITGYIIVCDIKGNEILKKEITPESLELSISLKNQNNGIYIGKIITNDGKYIKAFKLVRKN